MSGKHTLSEVVFKAFLENPDWGPKEMANNLQAKYNSVKAIFAKLCADGLITREGRGSYIPNTPKILLHLLDRIEDLENQKKTRGT